MQLPWFLFRDTHLPTLPVFGVNLAPPCPASPALGTYDEEVVSVSCHSVWRINNVLLSLRDFTPWCISVTHLWPPRFWHHVVVTGCWPTETSPMFFMHFMFKKVCCGLFMTERPPTLFWFWFWTMLRAMDWCSLSIFIISEFYINSYFLLILYQAYSLYIEHWPLWNGKWQN